MELTKYVSPIIRKITFKTALFFFYPCGLICAGNIGCGKYLLVLISHREFKTAHTMGTDISRSQSKDMAKAFGRVEFCMAHALPLL